MNSYIMRSNLKAVKTDYQTICSQILDKLKDCYEQTVILDCESGRKWTGEEVYESALNLAYYLIVECLLKPGDIVCFLAPDSDIHAISILGVWAAGGVYCSLPSHSTYREVDEALTRIEPSFLITDSYNYGISSTITSEMVSIKKLLLIDENSVSDRLNTNLDIIENILQFERSFLSLPVNGSVEDTCALLITSTSDGSTKAVIRTNRNLISAANALQNSESSDITKDDVVLTTGLYSGTGLNLFLHVITSGSTVAINENHRSDDQLLDCMQKYCITSALLTTSQLCFCIKNINLLNSLRDVWFGGTAIAEGLHKKAIDLFENFHKIFSTPEAGWVTTELLSETHSKPNHKTIGRPVAGVELKIVDSNGQSVPSNTVGEVCVRSHQCAPGYLNNGVESEHILMTDHFIRSGEYGYHDSEGLFYIVGHSEEFIKVDDFMISAEELESILLTQKGVKEVAVICTEDQTGNEFPKALVTLKKDFKHQNTDQSIEQLLINFVNLRVDPRKWLSSDGLEIMKDSPQPHMRKFSYKRQLETFL